MNINVLVDLDEIMTGELSADNIGQMGDETLMKIVPGVILFQVRIHSWKW